MTRKRGTRTVRIWDCPSDDEYQARVWATRDALTPVDDLTGTVDGTDAPTVAMLTRSVTYGWGGYWGGRYGLLTAMLPDLLVESRAALREYAVAALSRGGLGSAGSAARCGYAAAKVSQSDSGRSGPECR